MPHPTATATGSAAAKPAILPDTHIDVQARELYSASIAWFSTHWLQILIAIGFGALLFTALSFARKLGPRLQKRDHSGVGWQTVIGRALSRTGNFFLVMVAAKLVSGYAHPPQVVESTIAFFFTIATVLQAAIWTREIILGAVEHRTAGHGEALGSAIGLIRLLVTFVVFAIALVVVLDNLGVNVTGLVAGLGVGGIAIGLAAQGIFADLFAALAIIFDRPFRRGDTISYDKSSGTVEEIGLKSTRIRGVSGEQRIISNKNLLDKEILNNTRRDYRRVVFSLGLVQSTSVDAMGRLPDMMKEEIERCGARYVRCGFAAFGQSSYDFDVEFDSEGAVYQDMYDARHKVGLAIIRRLGDERIALAYPTQTSISASEAGLGVEDDAIPLSGVTTRSPPSAVPASPPRGDDTRGPAD